MTRTLLPPPSLRWFDVATAVADHVAWRADNPR
jgi:hypothetical protein